MFWFYWRRMRLAVLAVGVAVGSVAALVVVAGSLAGADPHQADQPQAVAFSGAQSRRSDLRPADTAPARRALLLMNAAILACQNVPYHGVQMVAWWGPDGSSAYIVGVWHRPGEPALAEGDDDDDGSPGSASRSVPATPSGSGLRSGSGQVPGSGQQPMSPPGHAAAGDHATAGVLSVSPWMLALLRANYLLEYSGTGTASSRPASIVTIRRLDGSLAARYWLDQATALPLRREMFDASGHLVNEGAFIDLRFGLKDAEAVPSVGGQAWAAQPASAGLSSLHRQGWSVPLILAGMTLVAITHTSTRSGSVIDASYSDGLSVVSVFIQRGDLPETIPGWRHTVVRGLVVYSSEPDERSLAWSAMGFVYTVIADAPQETVAQVVAQLPHDREAGLWQRVRRGLERMGSWLNPFG